MCPVNGDESVQVRFIVTRIMPKGNGREFWLGSVVESLEFKHWRISKGLDHANTNF